MLQIGCKRSTIKYPSPLKKLRKSLNFIILKYINLYNLNFILLRIAESLSLSQI